jgi:hypothetical protein
MPPKRSESEHVDFAAEDAFRGVERRMFLRRYSALLRNPDSKVSQLEEKYGPYVGAKVAIGRLWISLTWIFTVGIVALELSEIAVKDPGLLGVIYLLGVFAGLCLTIGAVRSFTAYRYAKSHRSVRHLPDQ